ncbi:hypothetical protein RHOFW510R12_01125 [Rhodanobacter sp. FW510-R12]|uniref:carbon storage regulator n=1 Tax=Rhodanobacter thiooxydans TaxID=416169 RepID=UPI00091B7BA0|nr:carbon storage regulator [Rhodanobacter thiooxydans]UJJ56659.1 carbon storage regulator [Rhodanobacter thiooxydans]
MALLLTRRRGQGVTIDIPRGDGSNEQLHVRVVFVKGGQCSLRFQAAPHVTIIRDELMDEPMEAGADA